MSGYFCTSIAFEVYISAAWVALTADVLVEPAPTWNRGIMGNGPLDLVGHPGQLVFYLNNSTTSIGGVAGYYSPGHTNCLTGWTTGLPVRLSFTYEGRTYYKFYGKIAPDGIIVATGQYRERYVQVMAIDYMFLISQHELNLPDYTSDKTIDQIIPLIIANMPIAPLATSYAAGVDTFPGIFDTVRPRTTAMAEISKVALSEFAPVYVKGDRTGGETLVSEARNTRAATSNFQLQIPGEESGRLLLEDGTYLLLETGDKVILSELQEADFDNVMSGMSLGYGRTLANYVKAVSYPRKIDAAATTVLFALQEPFEIKSGVTKSGFRGRYRDPSGAATRICGRDMVTPVKTTDYMANAQADGLGLDKTDNLTVTADYGTEAVEYTLVASADLFVTKLQARGKGVYIYDPVESVYEDSTSQLAHGVHPLVFDMKYQDDPTMADTISALALQSYKDPHTTVEQVTINANRNAMTLFGFLSLEPGSRARFTETQSGIDEDFFIQGYSASIVSKRYIIWQPVLKSTGTSGSGFATWDVGTWDVSTWGYAD